MKIEEAKERYKPENIKYLFISEAAPAPDSFRHFYYAYVEGKDDLFLNFMMALFPVTYKSYLPIKELRKSKKIFLETFRDKGCYLIDSVQEPFAREISRSLKINTIRENRENLLNEIQKLSNSQTKVILISATVYAACNDYLLENNINVVNDNSISFLDRWHKDDFHNQMKKLLEKIDWQNKAAKKTSSVTVIKKK